MLMRVLTAPAHTSRSSNEKRMTSLQKVTGSLSCQSRSFAKTAIADTSHIDGKDYQIGLRYKTIYKPYSLELKDTRAEYYVGTLKLPKWFSSDFVISDARKMVSAVTQTIWMNNPLRYRDETFYQVTL